MATGRRPATMRMYHVTNVRASAISKHAFVTIGGDKHAISVATKEPDWSKVRLCVPHDKYFDGDLCGLPVACFTTTLYKGELPDRSPYPRNAAPGTEHWRVSVPFDPDDYEIFKMHEACIIFESNEVCGQVQLLCLKKKLVTARDQHLDPDVLLMDLFMKSRDWTKKLLTKKDLETYFPDGNPNDCMYSNLEQKFFVNVHFVNPVPLFDTAEWTPVVKEHESGYNPIEKHFNALLNDWISNKDEYYEMKLYMMKLMRL